MNFENAMVEAPQMQAIVATTPEEKRKLFDRIKPKNWKGAIDKTIVCKDEDEAIAIQEAAMYFTGGVCEIDIVSEGPLRVRFCSLGYYYHMGA